MSTTLPTTPGVHYPDSDGKPMADNTLQFRWIVTIQGNIDLLFRDDPNVFVAGDNLIYPVEGDPVVCQAPDVYVAFGRPKGHRGSYKVFEEGGVFPQVVFEILSPNNTPAEMDRKRAFYERYGAEEYYVYDPDHPHLDVWLRSGGRLQPVGDPNGLVSRRLGVRFHTAGPELVMTGPDKREFLSFVEIGRLQQQAERLAAKEKRRADREKRKAEAEKQRAEKLADKLRELGIDPDAV